MPTVSVYCADIGSVAKHRFGWFGSARALDPTLNASMPALAAAVASDLQTGVPVALGFECPLFVPVTSDPVGLTLGRVGDRDRPWSAGAGCGALATGLTQVVWILREIRRLAPNTQAFLEWPAFAARGLGLFLWEAFVTGTAKRDGHCADAEAAVQAFLTATQRPELASDVVCSEDTYSLVGAALLRTGWSSDVALLARPCVVVRAEACGLTRHAPDGASES